MATSKTTADTEKKAATTSAKATSKAAPKATAEKAEKAEKKVAVSKKVTAKDATAENTTETSAKVAAPIVAESKEAAAPARKAAVRKTSPVASAEERYRMIQDAAYYLAEKNNFKGGVMGYWVAAEIEIEELLSKK
jgi:hypothetical protein